ncbi:MAG: FAD-dependent oxidoreductase [Pseudomonadota bacterium]
MLSRRAAIQHIAASVSAAMATQACARGAEETFGLTKGRVIVIGAGISGAKAARDLVDAGFEVVVLEARDRIGGRIWTNRDLGVPMDLGASWIHGARGNPVHALARQVGAPLYDWDYENVRLFGGDADTMFAASARYWRRIWRIADRVYDENANATAADLIDALKTNGVFDGLSDAEIAVLVSLEIEQEYAEDTDLLALSGVMEGEEFGGVDKLFPQGYDALFAPLLDGVDVRLNAPVTNIDYGSAGEGVRVTTPSETFEGDAALVSVSLGVLKGGGLSFSPDLSPAKQAAISGLGMGVLNKVVFQFDAAFWDPDINIFLRVSDAQARWASWFNMTNVVGAPVLVAFAGGREARALEALDDDAVIADALAALKTMFGQAVTEPVATLVTNWASDPYALGAYSIVSPGGRPEMRDDLSAPAGTRLYFCGEATSRDYPSTVHGAYLSGRDAAAAIKKGRR